MGINRYKLVINKNGTMQNLPKITIKERKTDKFVVYNYGKTRLDRIAGETYDDDTYWWLILMANPEYALEFDIPKNTVIRVPLPLRDVLIEYQDKVSYKKNKG